MAAPRKYGDELRERATRMAVEARKDPATRSGAIARVAEQLGMHPETLRGWVRQAEVDGGVRPGTTTDDATADRGARAGEPRAEAGQRDPANGVSVFRGRGARPQDQVACADSGAGRLHRSAPRPVRGRADL